MPLNLRDFRARDFRSLQSISYPMADLDIFVGANGVGKTNLYRGLELLQSAAANTLTRDLVGDGGLDLAIWAGERPRNKPARIKLGVGLTDTGLNKAGATCRYDVEVGFPAPTSAAFELEPLIKEETLTYLAGSRPVVLMQRKGASVMARGEDGRPVEVDMDIMDSETVLGRLEDPSRYPALDTVRRTLLQWRFYHGLRTDPGSPLRRPCPAVATATLASDGRDLAAVFATLTHIRQDSVDLDDAIEAAFPGAQLVVPPPGHTASFGMIFPEFPHRIFDASELSDGTLRFLALMGALLAYRLPPFMALNEPEASLHPDLMVPLGRMIANASTRTQVWLVTHSNILAQAASAGGGNVRHVIKTEGATQIEGLKRWGAFADDEDD